ncbi:hypothetical protein DRN94_003155, partial [archaeon]|nr:hypothetical protein [archaeon]
MGDVGSDAVRQAKRDWLAYVEAKLGMRIDELVMKALGGRKVIPVVVAWSFRPRTRSIARSHGVWLYSVGEFLELLRRYAPARAK